MSLEARQSETWRHAEQQGRKAARDGYPRESCELFNGDPHQTAWLRGHDAETRREQQRMKGVGR